jgi:hypothetical protein
LENEVSKARKEGYMQATNGMPGNPVNIAGVKKTVREQGNQTYGKN